MVVIPTYNEAENVPKLVGELFALAIPNLSILIVDDNSPDGTGEIAREIAARHPDIVHVIQRPAKLGLGTAYITGFRYALDKGARYVIQMDADFSHSPSYIPIMLEKIQEYDVVIGSRYIPGGRVDERWGLNRVLLSWWANAVYIPLILKLKVKDATSGFRCFRREVLEAIDFSRVRSNGYVFQVEMIYLCEKLGFRVLEIPIYFEDRRIGKSKLNFPVKVEAAFRVWEIKWRYRNLNKRVVK
ncbi:MAG: polyprenol monophosphomannose synthase [Anaerolineae bacterium]|nr:polyprenol monophosphomannose synthase [Anaerolineae bacterium]MDW8101461.1 polyprenol monophosphomannose synthase [Anaerolineae bacterium]